MALSDSIAAYDDCFNLFDRAVADGKGARALYAQRGQAIHMRQRLNHARVLMRRQSMKLYEQTDPRYNKSEYDRFKVCMYEADATDGGWWIYIEPFTLDVVTIEGLSEIEQ